LGMWDEAVASDESSFAASVDRVKRQGLSMAQADFHSLGWLHYEYLQQGRFAKAREIMQTVERAIVGGGPAEAGHYRNSDSSDSDRSGRGSSSDRSDRGSSVVSGFSRTVENAHQHVESEIGKGFNPISLKSELASMKARLVIESGAWSTMKGVGTFDNIDELFALGMASVKLGDARRAEAALDHLGTASKTV